MDTVGDLDRAVVKLQIVKYIESMTGLIWHSSFCALQIMNVHVRIIDCKVNCSVLILNRNYFACQLKKRSGKMKSHGSLKA